MPDTPDTVMLFAAGRGTRMAPLTDTQPKPLVKVAGRSLADHALEIARGAGLSRIVANTHYLPERLEAHLRARGVQVIREAELLETGGGLRNALPLLGPAPVITMNSDAVWRGENPISAALSAWRPEEMDALLVLIAPERATGHGGAGDFRRDTEGRLSRGPGYVYSGVQIVKTARLGEIGDPVFSLNRLWNMMAADGRLFGEVYSGDWCDVGRPESIALAEAMLDV